MSVSEINAAKDAVLELLANILAAGLFFFLMLLIGRAFDR
jgi:hypothetical protein